MDLGFKDCLKAEMAKDLPPNLQQHLSKIDSIDEAQIQQIAESNKAAMKAEMEAEKELIQQQAVAENCATQKAVDRLVVQGHNVQEAQQSVSYTEQVMSESKFTDQFTMSNTDYSTSINYPDRYGKVDNSKNWFAVDKKEKSLEAVHNSGTLGHVDRDGNVSIHITGSLRFIVDKDISFEVRGNKDEIIKGSEYTHISGQKVVAVDGSLESSVVGAITDKTMASRTFDTGAAFDNKVGGGFNTEAAGVVINSAGGSSMKGNLSVEGSVMDTAGNSNHHSH